MATFTICFCGTDCWPDESMPSWVARGKSASKYGAAGYLPARIFSEITSAKAIVPGPGQPHKHFEDRLWVPSDVWNWELPGVEHTTDSVFGRSMDVLAGHAAARAVGIPSLGKIERPLHSSGDSALIEKVNALLLRTGANVNPGPDHGNTALLGDGKRYQFDDSLIELLLQAAGERNAQGRFSAINLIGHSRGAVVALLCAHELHYLFPEVPVNIFAIDPVPGTTAISHRHTWLAANVKNYVAVYAVDEVSNGFNGLAPRPVDRRTAQAKRIDPLLAVAADQRITVPNYHLIYSRGRHGTVAGNQTADGADGTPSRAAESVGLLVNQLARACLSRWGTGIAQLSNLRSLRELKDDLNGNSTAYKTMRSTTYTGPVLSPYICERGITADSAQDTDADWHYLETVIGDGYIVPRGLTDFERRVLPGQVRWKKLQDIDDSVFTTMTPGTGDSPLDRTFERI